MRQLELLDVSDNLPGLSSAKRKTGERSGVHGWHPYYAGYSENFVRTSLEYLKLPKKAVVLDPWCGSGTTCLVASRMGVPSIGVDINPAMAVFSAAKAVDSIVDTDLRDSILAPLRGCEIEANDPLLEILSPSLVRCVREVKQRINCLNSCDVSRGMRGQVKPSATPLDAARSYLLAGLFITARRLSGYKKASNPTWFKAIEKKPACKPASFLRELGQTWDSMQSSLIRALDGGRAIHRVLVGDSRSLPVRSSSIDAVITSPPYLTRIDYAVSTKLELLILSDCLSSDSRQVRENSMGATTIRKATTSPVPEWGDSCIELLRQVAAHPAKSSENYYLKNITQYFDDAFRSLVELHRVMRSKAKSLIVVQSSYFKQHEIRLGDIYIEMGESLGFAARRVFRETVRGHMAHVNTQSSPYIKNKVYFEDVIELSR